MRFLVGTWNCTVRSSRRPRPFQETHTISISADGYWLLTRAITMKVPWNPITITRDDRTTYDVTNARWVDLGTDDYGLYDVTTSPGWNGNSIRWSEVLYPKLHAAAVMNPIVFTKTSATSTIADSSFIEPSGQKVSVVTRCTKV